MSFWCGKSWHSVLQSWEPGRVLVELVVHLGKTGKAAFGKAETIRWSFCHLWESKQLHGLLQNTNTSWRHFKHQTTRQELLSLRRHSIQRWGQLPDWSDFTEDRSYNIQEHCCIYPCPLKMLVTCVLDVCEGMTKLHACSCSFLGALLFQPSLSALGRTVQTTN